MRVAVLAHSFPRFPADTHGPFVKNLCESLARLGHEVHVLVPFDSELRPDPDTPLEIDSFRYVWPDSWHLLGYSRTLKGDVGMKLRAWLLSPLYGIFAQRALGAFVRKHKIELIHAHWLLPNGYAAWRVARAAGIPFAVTMHGSDVFMAEKNPLFRAMARGTAANAAHVTSCSADLRDRVLALGGVPEDRVILLPNGTEVVSSDRPNAKLLVEKFDLKDDERHIVAVGRMVYKKGFTYLLHAMRTIKEKGPNVRLILGGGGDILEALKREAVALGVDDRVTFTGLLSHEEVLDLISLGEMFVMPSVRDQKGNIDGLPIVVLEAMAAGKPVVGTDLAGLPLAIEDGVSGRLVPEKDADSLAAAIMELLGDSDRAREMGEKGRQRVEKDLNWDEIAKRHDALYRAAVDHGVS